MSNDTFTFGTRLIHNENSVDKETGAVSVPINHTSTFHQFALFT